MHCVCLCLLKGGDLNTHLLGYWKDSLQLFILLEFGLKICAAIVNRLNGVDHVVVSAIEFGEFGRLSGVSDLHYESR